MEPRPPDTREDSGDGVPEGSKIAAVPEPETPTKWWAYVRHVAGDATQLEIAHRAGIDKSHPTRWKQGFAPGAEFVVRFAEAYDRNALEALVAAEIITEEQANLREVRVTELSEIPSKDLLAELARRIPQ